MDAEAPETQDGLSGISGGDLQILEQAVGLREAELESSGLDARTFALVKVAALIALDAPPASYAWQVANALDEGASPEDIRGGGGGAPRTSSVCCAPWLRRSAAPGSLPRRPRSCSRSGWHCPRARSRWS